MSATNVPESIPSWVGSLGVPVWVSDPSGNIGYLNGRAAELLGVAAGAAVGQPCHEVVAARDAAGNPHCGPNCAVLECARRDRELEPLELCLRRPEGGDHWVQVLIISIQEASQGRPWLVHCAVPRDRSHRIEEYLARVATRTGTPRPGRCVRPRCELTARENQVLQLLAEDHSLYTISDELCISYVTVRNHVQHILIKLDVHSIMEAVARYLDRPQDTGE